MRGSVWKDAEGWTDKGLFLWKTGVKERKKASGGILFSFFLSMLHRTQLNKTGAEADHQKPDLKVSPTPTRIQTERRELSVCGCVSRARTQSSTTLSAFPIKAATDSGFFLLLIFIYLSSAEGVWRMYPLFDCFLFFLKKIYFCFFLRVKVGAHSDSRSV